MSTIIFNLSITVLKLVINRMLILILYTSYILIKYHYSKSKKPGMRHSIWITHLWVDKCVKFFSTSWRKKYHRRVYKIVKKAKYWGIISE